MAARFSASLSLDATSLVAFRIGLATAVLLDLWARASELEIWLTDEVSCLSDSSYCAPRDSHSVARSCGRRGSGKLHSQELRVAELQAHELQLLGLCGAALQVLDPPLVTLNSS